jgi:hypothetical protein
MTAEPRAAAATSDADEALQSQAARHAAAIKARCPPHRLLPLTSFSSPRLRLLSVTALLLPQSLTSQHAVAIEEAVKRAELGHAAEVDRLNAEVTLPPPPQPQCLPRVTPCLPAPQIIRLNGERLAFERENNRLKEQVRVRIGRPKCARP